MISKEIKFLLTHSSIYGIGTVVSRLVAFILLPLYTRYLTPADYGFLETVDISSGLIGIVVTVGIARALSRFYYEPENQKKRNRIVSTTYITYFGIAFLSIPFLYLLSNPLAHVLFNSMHYGYLFKLSFASLIVGGIVDIGLMYLRLIKKPTVFITITISRLILLISLNIVFIVYFRMGILGILYSSLITRSLTLVLLTTPILLKTKVSYSLKTSIQMLKYALPMIPSTLANAAVKQSDKYFVLYFMSISDMGIYSLALKIGNAIHNLLTIPFNMAYIPRRFELMKNEDASKTYSHIFTYYTFIVVFVGLTLSVLIPEILKFMVTPEFQRAGKIIPLVVLSMIIFGTHFHFDFGILFSKKTKYLAYINISCALIQLLCNFLLIRLFGLYGAVISSIIVLGIQAALLYLTSQRFFRIRFEFKRVFAFMAVAAIVFLLSRVLQNQLFWLNMLVKISLLLIFVLVIYFSKILTNNEKEQIGIVLRRRILSKFRGESAVITT